MQSRERLDYYLMVARLMAEAEAQMRADAIDPGSGAYALDLQTLRLAVRGAEDAAARIAVSLMDLETVHAEDEGAAIRLRH